jgi:hypothetical protein
MFNAWSASMNVGSKHPVAGNNSWHAPSYQFYLHCGSEETGSPGIIGIICHQVLRHPSDYATSSMGTHWLGKAHIVKLHKLTESGITELTSCMRNETALAIVNREWSRKIPIVSSQRKFSFDFQVLFTLTKLKDKMFQTGREGLWYCWILPPGPGIPTTC